MAQPSPISTSRSGPADSGHLSIPAPGGGVRATRLSIPVRIRTTGPPGTGRGTETTRPATGAVRTRRDAESSAAHLADSSARITAREVSPGETSKRACAMARAIRERSSSIIDMESLPVARVSPASTSSPGETRGLTSPTGPGTLQNRGIVSGGAALTMNTAGAPGWIEDSVMFSGVTGSGSPPPPPQAAARSTGQVRMSVLTSRLIHPDRPEWRGKVSMRLFDKPPAVILASLPLVVLLASCGSPQTAGFFAGPLVGRESSSSDSSPAATPPTAEDTLLNCTFDNILDAPFGPGCRFEIYHGGLHIDNSASHDAAVLLSTASLLRDGLVEAVFEVDRSRPHSVLGLILRAEDYDTFLMAGVNSRGQYTVQRCLGGLWTPVMGLDPFESSRLLPFDPERVVLTAEIHGNYVDFSVNGQLLQVVRTTVPVMGQTGVFVDAWTSAVLDRFTVVPLSRP